MKTPPQKSLSNLSTAVFELPKKAISNAGFEFCPQDRIWEFADQSRRFRLNFDSFKGYCHPDLIHSFKKVLLFYIQNTSASHSRNIFWRFLYFIQSVADDSMNLLCNISSIHIINYKANLPANQQWYLSTLSGFFKKWHSLGYPGIEPDVVSFFTQIRLKGNRKGDAVRTMDSIVGPYTEIELQALQGAINDAYAAGDITTREYVLVWLFMALGPRNVQIAALKIKDFNVQYASDGTPSYLLNVPRAKQRASRIRDQFRQRALIKEIGEVLEVWLEDVKNQYLHLSGGTMKNCIDPGDLPLFPVWGKPNPINFEHHADGKDLAREILKVFKNLYVISERTGDEMHVTTRRFRYTLGTRAAQEGHGELIIADLLDHTDTQQVGVYVESTPEIMERIDKALALQLAPMAQAFMGQIIHDESEAERGDDPASRIRSPKSDPATGCVGNCGKYGFCGAFAPIACYTCRNFRAWLDGPHVEILDDLLSERERLLKQTGDERIAFANDRTIFAVAEVVRKCTEMKQEMEAV